MSKISTKAKFQNIEALRGFAALYVVLHHCKIGKGSWVSYFTMQGQVAVMLFFLVSGFVIYYSVHKNKSLSFKEYFIKRFKRIYFIFIAALLLSYLVACFKSNTFLIPDVKQLLINLVNLQDLSRHPGYFELVFYENNPLWSLSYEWWFYMLFFPIFKYVKDKHQNLLVIILSLFGLISFWLLPNMFSIILWYFIIWWWGVILAKIYIRKGAIDFPDLKFIFLSFLICIALMGIMAYTYSGQIDLSRHPIIQIRHFIYSFALVIFGWVWYKLKLIGFKQTIKPFLIFAPISYGVYVFHYPLVVLLRKELFDNIWLHCLVMTVFSIILAYLFEKILYPYAIKRFK